jgi:hypothetical protein
MRASDGERNAWQQTIRSSAKADKTIGQSKYGSRQKAKGEGERGVPAAQTVQGHYRSRTSCDKRS